MTATLGAIWRHPIKAHGREAVARVNLRAGETMPWDRVWGVLHEAARPDMQKRLAEAGWAPCSQFSRGAKSPSLMAITARHDTDTDTIELNHPDRPVLRLDPDRDEDAFLAWIAPLTAPGRAAPRRLVRGGRGLTDTDYPSISIASRASHEALAKAMCRSDLSMLRWRCNLWLDGLDPWAEAGWIGRDIAIGSARLRIVEPITRCRATHGNPQTGIEDADILGALDTRGYREFGLYAEVIGTGEIAEGDQVRLL